jgi:hypothetical protein
MTTVSGVSSMITSTPVAVSKGADVPSFAPDDPPLHLVARQRHCRHRGLGRVFRRDALRRHRDDPAGLAIGALPRLVLDVARQRQRGAAGLVFHPLQELLACIGRRQAGDLLQLGQLLRRETCGLLFPPGELLVARIQLLHPLAEFTLLRVQLALAPFQHLAPFLDPPLQPPDLLPSPHELLLQRLAHLHRLHLGGEDRFGPGVLDTLRRLVPDARGVGPRIREDTGGGFLLDSAVDKKETGRDNQAGRDPLEEGKEQRLAHELWISRRPPGRLRSGRSKLVTPRSPGCRAWRAAAAGRSRRPAQ